MNYNKIKFTSKYKLLSLSLWLGVVSILSAQKEPQFTQYMYNIGSFNPAYVGTVETPEIIGSFRSQWVDIPGAPTSIRFGVNKPFSNKKSGIGFNIVSDELGPSTQTFVDLAYSYEFNVSENTKLSFGINAGGSFLNVDFSKGTFENPNEPLLGRELVKEFYPIIGAGFFLYNSDVWYLGTSVPNLLTDGILDDEVAAIINDQVQLNFIGGYVFDISENFKFKPAFLINYINGAPVNTNLSANFLINNKFTLGASYRFDNAVSGIAGFQINGGTFLGYSYDYNTNGLSEFSGGSHEVILKFYLGKGGQGNSSGKQKNKKDKDKPQQIDSPRFF